MIIDINQGVILQDGSHQIDLYSPEGFKIVSDLWLNVGWDQKYSYGFSWLGRPVIQIPEDLLLIQEVIFKNKKETNHHSQNNPDSHYDNFGGISCSNHRMLTRKGDT